MACFYSAPLAWNPTGVDSEPRWQWQAQLAARRFLAFCLMLADTDLVQFGFAHDARQPQQQTIVVEAWIVNPLAVRYQDPEHRAELE